MRHATHRTFAPALLLAAAALGGCASRPTELHADGSGPVFAARAGVSSADGRRAVEFEASRVRTRETQTIGDYDTVRVNGQFIDGPTRLFNRAAVDSGQALYRHRIVFGRRFEFEWLLGAAVLRTDWQTESARATDPVLNERRTWFGPAGGVAGRLKLDEGLAIEARATAATRLGGDAADGSRQAGELVLAWAPGGPAVLRAGFVNSSSAIHVRDGDSRQRAHVRGLILNLGLEF